MFVKQSIIEQRITVDSSLRYPNKNTIQAIEDARNGVGLSAAYDNVEDLEKTLDTEDQIAKKI